MRQTKIIHSEEDRTHFARELINHGHVGAFLYNVIDPPIKSILAFLKGTYLIGTFDGGVLAGFGVFDWIDGTTYWAHFGTFEGYEDEVIERGFDVISMANACGCETLLGLTPVPYRHVGKALTAWGFEKIAVIPNACYIARKNKNYDGVLTKKILT